MVKDYFEVIRALAESEERELTIHQISKAINKSYAYTNKHAHGLIKTGILKKKIIGPSILCSLDFSKEETIASLVYLSMIEKSKYKTNEKQDYAIEKYSKIGIIVHYNGKIILISDEKVKDTRLKLISKEEFLQDARNYDLSKIIILANHEQFWRLIAKVMP
jgi:hypothetical protein